MTPKVNDVFYLIDKDNNNVLNGFKMDTPYYFARVNSYDPNKWYLAPNKFANDDHEHYVSGIYMINGKYLKPGNSYIIKKRLGIK